MLRMVAHLRSSTCDCNERDDEETADSLHSGEKYRKIMMYAVETGGCLAFFIIKLKVDAIV